MDWTELRRRVKRFCFSKKVMFTSYFFVIALIFGLVMLNVAYGWKVGLIITGLFFVVCFIAIAIAEIWRFENTDEER